MISPYEELKLTADSIIAQLESFRDNDKDVLSEMKQETHVQKKESISSSEIFDRIEQLGKLRENNTITEEEFKRLKMVLLSRL